MGDELTDSQHSLRRRLELAETICTLVGWMASDMQTVKGKALTELWMRWAALVPPGFTDRKAHPELSREAIRELARQRDETRERVLRALSGEESREDVSVRERASG